MHMKNKVFFKLFLTILASGDKIVKFWLVQKHTQMALLIIKQTQTGVLVIKYTQVEILVIKCTQTTRVYLGRTFL